MRILANFYSIGDWISFLLLGTAAFGIAIYSTNFLRRHYLRKRKAFYRIDLHDSNWDLTSAFQMQIIAFLSGFIVGVLSIGEGAIFVVLFVELQKHPKVSIATGMYINIIISFGFALVFAVEGYVDDWYYLVFGVIAIIASVLGIFISDFFYRRFNTYAIPIMIILIAAN